ncbi:fermitin family homolog 3-like isoform X1 [Falco naumanni]|uniref:fermitin family homolog 3-like isoform X1 n=1 Tax=Falco naumanni TaxID=148594 RepID=UPI001ADE6A68|nr:fermitin family homolog 3-like isoform X1 [Falco naumanni]
MAGLKTASGETIDGSFELQVEVEEGDAGGQAPPPAGPPCPPAAPRTLALRVTGDLHVGGLMLLIVETVGVQRDWSDHALWWVQRRQWLLRPARTLDALGVGGDARLRFAPQHRPLRLRLPNRRCLRLRLSFAEPLAQGVSQACRLLGIRYPEELSLLWPLEEEEAGGEGRKGSSPPPPPDFDLSHLALPPGEGGSVSSEPLPHLPPDCYRMLVAPRGGLGPIAPPRTPRGNPLLRRTRLHAGWLDSSRSLMEQDVADDEELLLRFKYHCFLDLGPQQDSPRLALLYEQARWALLTEEIDCTEEEMMLFAALQYHIDEVVGSGEPGGAGGGSDLDDLDVALSNLEVKLGGGTEPLSPLEELAPVPELAEELEIYRPRKLALRGFRPTWAVLKETSLSYGRSPPTRGEPLQQLNLRGCEVTPDVDVGAQKFCIKLLVAAPEGMSEIQLRCRDAPQYARWLAGCRLASRGRSLGGAALGAEAQGVLGVLGLPPGGGGSAPPPAGPPRPPPDPRVLLAPRFQRKVKAKQLVPRILEVLHRLGALPLPQARLRFLEAWRALPGFGLAHFLVRFKGSRRDEVLAIGPSRLLRLEPGSGTVTRAWRHSALRQWNVNWDTQQVTLELEGQVTLALAPRSAPCRVLHEFLGGYLCLAGRQPGQPLDLRLFQQLTGGQEPL